MQYNNYHQTKYNPLGNADPDSELNVSADTQGYHEIKVYNLVRDRMWDLYSTMVLSSNPVEVLAHAEQIQVILLRADSIWRGIQSSANTKASTLGIGNSKYFEYGGQMKELSNKVKRYVNFYQNPGLFIDRYNKYDKEFEQFANSTEEGKMQYLKNRLEDIVVEVDTTWGELASKIGMGLPLKIAEETELFFRGRGSSTNRVHEGGV